MHVNINSTNLATGWRAVFGEFAGNLLDEARYNEIFEALVGLPPRELRFFDEVRDFEGAIAV